MYYVIFTGTGNEKLAEQLIEKYGSEFCNACYCPTVKYKKKIRGREILLYKKLLPGYVFISTEDVDALYKKLREAHVFHKIMETDRKDDSIDFYSLTDSEVQWLHQIMGNPEEMQEAVPAIELSQIGFDENDEVIIISGPLKDYSGIIKKIDLHRRIAQVEVEFMKRKTVLYLGIELVEKK
jgi:transcriptional antiterminator NusG